VVTEGLDEPFGVKLSTIRTVEGFDDGIGAWIALLRGPHPVEQLDVYHNGFTDFVGFSPQAALVDQASGVTSEAAFRTDARGLEHGVCVDRCPAGFSSRLHAQVREPHDPCHGDCAQRFVRAPHWIMSGAGWLSGIRRRP
jgi:hypothetical protein